MGRVSIGDALSTSWQAFIRNIAMLVLGGLLVMIISLCVILVPPMTVGLYIMCLKALRGQQIEIGDVFAGFSYIIPAYVVMVVIGVAVAILYFIAAVPIMAAAGIRGEAPQRGLVAMGISMMIIVTIAVLLLAPIFGLAVPAVADGMGGIEALSFSFSRGLANWPALFVLSIIIAVVQGVVGSLTGFGSLLTMPWSCTVLAAAYLQALGEGQEGQESAEA